MIDAEKLLTGLIRKSLSGKKKGRSRSSRGLVSLVTPGMAGAVGLGALGIAIAAFEHFSGKSNPSSPASPHPGSVPPPPPGRGTPRSVPPPPPGAPASSESPGRPEAPPPVANPGLRQAGQDEALLLVRAMLAAANADGHIDEAEKSAILDYLAEDGLTEEESEFVRRALTSPPSIDSLLPRIQSPDLAMQVYAASLLAINVDTRAEREYLNYLKVRLGLDEQTAGEIEAGFK